MTVEVTRQALEEHFQRPLDQKSAVLKAVEIQTHLQSVANRVSVDDGKVRITSAALSGRDWEE